MAETAPRARPVPELPPPAWATVTFREVFADREFRAIWLAELASIAGDQFARVALTVIVFHRTGSPLLTALTYAASYLPWLIGGLFLSSPGRLLSAPRRHDRRGPDPDAPGGWPWCCPACRCGGWSLLLFAVTALNAPFQGARSALRASILPGDRYAVGLAVSQVTRETGVVGGLRRRRFHRRRARRPGAALADRRRDLRRLPRSCCCRGAAPPRARTGSALSGVSPRSAAGVRLVFTTGPGCGCSCSMAWLAAFYSVAQALAVPYAAHLRHGAGGGRADLRGRAARRGRRYAGVHPAGEPRRPGCAGWARWPWPPAWSCSGCLARPGLAGALVILVISGLLGRLSGRRQRRLRDGCAGRLGAGQAYALANAG